MFLYILHTFSIVLISFPIALWGILNSYLPYKTTHCLSRKLSKGTDQHDTAKVLIGLSIFSLFSGLQGTLIYQYFGIKWLVIYVVSLLISSVMALSLRGENLSVFFLFLRKKDLKTYMEKKRQDIEVELA